jgi:hypothetical protein
LGALVSGCDDKPKDEIPMPPPATSLPSNVTYDASAFATDPPAPAGDLKTDLDNFVNLDTCVSQRAKLDPLVGDALGSIGYDTFLRDACRMLEAAKDKKKETCERIDSSPLRRRCTSWVAMIAQAPDDCPLQYDGLPARGRVPACVAIASRDPRLCAGEGRTQARATCEAMVNKDPSKCSVLQPNQKAQCERESTRWSSILTAPLEGLDKLPVPRATLVINDAGTTDFTSDLTNGVVVVTARGERNRVEIGSVVESELARLPGAPQRTARVGIALLADPKPSIQKIELVLPGDPPFVSPPATCDCKVENTKVEAKRGSQVTFTISGKLQAGTRVQPFKVDVTTWVRDVASDSLGVTRLVPPVHPSLPMGAGLRDGG